MWKSYFYVEIFNNMLYEFKKKISKCKLMIGKLAFFKLLVRLEKK